MARVALGLVGAAIGAPFGLASVGWVIGSAIGGTFEPTIRTEGPKISDLTFGTSSYGEVIPRVYGRARVPAKVIWASSKRQIAHEHSSGGGKGGGGGSTYTDYTYDMDLLILLTDNPITSVPRIWLNGKLVYNTLTTAGILGILTGPFIDNSIWGRMLRMVIQSIAANDHWDRCTVYKGGPTQLPDPTYEAAVGAGNAPAYRGRGYVFIQNYHLGASGMLPNLTFEVFSDNGTIDTVNMVTGTLCKFDQFTDTSQNYFVTDVGPDFGKSPGASRVVGSYFGQDTSHYSLKGNTSANMEPILLNECWKVEIVFRTDVDFLASGNLFTMTGPSSFGDYPKVSVDLAASPHLIFVDIGSVLNATKRVQIGLGDNNPGGVYPINIKYIWIHAKVQYDALSGMVSVYYLGKRVGYFSLPFPVNLTTHFDNITVGNSSITTSVIYATNVLPEDLWRDELHDMTPGYFTSPLGKSFITHSFLANDVAGVISDLCIRSGLRTNQFDTSGIGLGETGTPFYSLAITQVTSARAVIDSLMSVYFLDCVLSDKLYFRNIPNTASTTIPYLDLGFANSTTVKDPFPLVRTSRLETATQTAMTYIDVLNDYLTDTQYSDKLLGSQISTNTVQVPVGLQTQDAKYVVDTLMAISSFKTLSAAISVGDKYSEIEPGDVIFVTDKDTEMYSLKVVKKRYENNIITFETLQARADSSYLDNNSVTSNTPGGQSTLRITDPILLNVLDIPTISDKFNFSNVTFVARTSMSDTWHGGVVFDSPEGVNYTKSAGLTNPGVSGMVTEMSSDINSPLTASTYNMINHCGYIIVNVGPGSLSSLNHDTFLSSTTSNLAKVGNELLRFMNADLVSDGIYRLTGFLRTRFGTEDIPYTHIVGEDFILLDTTIVAQAVSTSEVGLTKYYKALAIGQSVDNVSPKSIVYRGNGSRPLKPVYLRYYYTEGTNDFYMTWSRRTRVQENWLSGSVPLGEVLEKYEVDFLVGTTVIRTKTVTTNTVAYSAAEQTADGAPGGVDYAVVYQISDTVGRGTF
jgi:hypothetical protein